MTDVTTYIDQKESIDALRKIALATPETRRMMSVVSIKFFAKYYLGIELGNHQEKWANRLVKTKRGVILAPCGHGKTILTSYVLPLWLLCRNRNIRILLCSKSDSLALKNIAVIKHELENNQRLIGDFGRFYNADNVWTGHQLFINRTKLMKDPTIEAIGLTGAITGGRFDVIIFDDILDVLNTREESQRIKTKDYIDGTLIPRLEPWGTVWAVGTRKHYDDYYATMIQSKTWTVVHDQAIIRRPTNYTIVESEDPIELVDAEGNTFEVYLTVKWHGPDRGEVLWPEHWSIDNLLLLEYSIGSTVFLREYQNEISSDENALFQLAALQGCRCNTISYVQGKISKEVRNQFSAIIGGVDPSLINDKKKAEARDSDYMVIWTVGVRSDGVTDLLGRVRVRGLSPANVEKAILAEYLRLEPDYFFIETNSFGSIHAHNLIEKWSLRLIKHDTTGNKHDLYTGVPALAVRFENNRMRLPYQTPEDKQITDEIIKEFHGLGIEKHDDQVMAAWICETGVMRFLKGRMKMIANRERARSVRG